MSISVIYIEMCTKHIYCSTVVRFRVLRVMIMKSAVLYSVMPYILVHMY